MQSIEVSFELAMDLSNRDAHLFMVVLEFNSTCDLILTSSINVVLLFITIDL